MTHVHLEGVTECHVHWDGCHHLVDTSGDPCICEVPSSGTYCCMQDEPQTLATDAQSEQDEYRRNQ